MICKGHTACIAQLNAAKIKIGDTLPLLSLCRRPRHCPERSQAGHCSRLRQHASRISHQTSRPKGPSMACCFFTRVENEKRMPKAENSGRSENQEQSLVQTGWIHLRCKCNYFSTTTFALCYSVAEYYYPVWSRSALTGLVDLQLNSSMRLISGPGHPIRPTQVAWLPLLSNIKPTNIRRKAACDKLL